MGGCSSATAQFAPPANTYQVAIFRCAAAFPFISDCLQHHASTEVLLLPVEDRHNVVELCSKRLLLVGLYI